MRFTNETVPVLTGAHLTCTLHQSCALRDMTATVVAPSALPEADDKYVPAVDPEADAAEAVATLKEYVNRDVPAESATLIKNWDGLEEYIGELCSYGLDRLSREPEDLNATCVRLRGQLEDVSCGNYRALIESFECAGAVRKGVSDVRSRLDELVDALPLLADATRQFSANVAGKQRERDRRLRAIREHTNVVDILEMPRLMRTLVTGELYDEALELRENAVKLGSMHPDEALIQDVCSEMDVLTQQMVLQLLLVLRNPVQLPMCLRVVGFLRRLGVFSEFRLRVLFLHSRGEWMRSGIESTTSPAPQARLVHLSDSTRAMVFEIITQYRAVFNDDGNDDVENDTAPNGMSMNGGANLTGNVDGYSRPKSRFFHASAILFDWTASCVSNYLKRLEIGIRDIREGAALNTVLQQAMYCGQSLGRVGADFRSALAPLFENAVLRIYSSHLTAALRQFEMMIDDHRWAPVGSSALRNNRRSSIHGARENATNGVLLDAKTEDVASNGDDADGDDCSAENDHYDPPVGVLDSPPLAVFLNGILAALNELRSCAPVTLGPQLGLLLQNTLIQAAEYMSAVGGPGGAFLRRSDRPHFAAMATSLRDLCVQHAARCLDFCMGETGLVNVRKVRGELVKLFGESVAVVEALRHETISEDSPSVQGSILGNPEAPVELAAETRDAKKEVEKQNTDFRNIEPRVGESSGPLAGVQSAPHDTQGQTASSSLVEESQQAEQPEQYLGSREVVPSEKLADDDSVNQLAARDDEDRDQIDEAWQGEDNENEDNLIL